MKLKRVIVTVVALLMAAPFGAMPAYAMDTTQPSVIVSGEPTAAADKPSAEIMTVDALLVRPLGLVATILGAGIFIVSLPFSALGGNVGEAGHALVVAPAKMTFTRPLGEFHR